MVAVNLSSVTLRIVIPFGVAGAFRLQSQPDYPTRPERESVQLLPPDFASTPGLSDIRYPREMDPVQFDFL